MLERHLLVLEEEQVGALEVAQEWQLVVLWAVSWV